MSALVAPSACDLGCAIRALRRRRPLTIEALAFAAELHPTYLSGIERGRRNPSWMKMCALACALEVTIAELVACAESERRVRTGIEAVLARESERAALAAFAIPLPLEDDAIAPGSRENPRFDRPAP